MKKYWLLLFLLLANVGIAQIYDSSTLRLRTNLDIVPNNNGSITATKLNNLLNGNINVWGSLLNLKLDSVWVIGNKLYTLKNGVTYSFLMNVTASDSTVSNLVNYYTKTASNARYLRKDTTGTIAGELTVNGLNTNFLNLKDSTLTKYVNLKTNATNSSEIYFPDGQNMGGGIYRSTVAYQNWVNNLLSFYLKVSDTLTTIATKTDIANFATTSSVNAALALKVNTTDNTVIKYVNTYSNFLAIATGTTQFMCIVKRSEINNNQQTIYTYDGSGGIYWVASVKIR